MYRQVEESQTLLINTQSKLLESQNKKIIKFGFGQSPFMPPEFVLEAFKNAVQNKEYSSVQGDIDLRINIAQFHKLHNGLQVTPENILIAPGSKILIFTVLMAYEKADVFIATPSWVSYAPQAKLAGHNLIKIDTSFEERWRIMPEKLVMAAKSKKHKASILILNYPGNPDGLSYSESELERLAQVVRELDMCVISDEIYGLLDYRHNHLSFANFYPDKTITTTGLSKWCGAGGWRFGAAFLYENIEAEFKQALIGIGSETYSCAPTPVQMAAKVAYSNFDRIRDYLKRQTDILKEIGTYCAERLSLSGIRVHQPEGGFYIFPDFALLTERLHTKGIFTSVELCQHLLKDTGVALLPASAFGFEHNHLSVRLAFVDFENPLAKSNFDLKTDCPNVVEGIDKICAWVANL